MSPWVNGKWQKPTQQQAQEAGASGIGGGYTPSTTPTQPAQQPGQIPINMSPGFAAKYQEALTQQQAGTLPGQLPQQQMPLIPAPTTPEEQKGWFQKASEWVSNTIRKGTGQLPIETERAVSGVEPAGTSMIELLGIGAAASAPMLMAKSLGAGIAGKIATQPLHVTKASAALYKSTGVIKANPKTSGLISNAISKQMISFGITTRAANYWLAATAGSIGIGYWGKAEALRESDYAYQNALKTGDPELIRDVKEMRDAIFDPSTFSKIFRTLLMLTPGAGIPGITDKMRAARAQKDVTDWMVEYEDQTKTISEQIEETKEKTLALQEEYNKKFNEDRIITEKEILRLKGEYTKEQRVERKKQLQEEIEMWRLHQTEMERIKEENAERQRQFLLEYLERKRKLLEEGGRSTLGFGLL